MADLGIFDRLDEGKPARREVSGDLGIFDQIQPTESKGFFETLGSDVAGIPGSLYQTVRHPIETGKALYEMQKGEFSKAGEEFGKKHYSEAFGHGLAALLPVVGPAAAGAGEELGTPGQAGAGLAHTAELLGPEALKVLPTRYNPTRVLTRPLRTAAEKTYAQVLAPGTKADKFLTARKLLTPAGKDLLQRRVMGLTEKGLHARIGGKLAQAEQNLDAAWQQLGPLHQQHLTPILDALQDRAVREATESVGGTQFPTRGLGQRRIIDPDLYSAYQDIAGKVIESMGPVADEASSYSLRKFRQMLDRRVKTSFTGGELTGAQKVAQRGAADAIREVLNSSDPTLSAANREYSFWRSAKDVFEHTSLRRVGQKGALRKLAGAAGAGAGAILGGETGGVGGAAEGIVIGRIAAEKLDAVLNSTAWKTVSAVSKNRVAELLAQGKGDQAAALAARAAAYSALRDRENQ